MTNFFYIDETTKQQFGPFSINQLQTRGLKPNTMVWATGMNDWQEARNVKELAPLFNSNMQGSIPPPIPTPQTGNVYSGGTYTVMQSAQGSLLSDVNMSRPCPKNWLVESILVGIFCCSFISLIGIIFASQVESKYRRGDYEGAEKSAKTAKMLTLIGLGLTLVQGVIGAFVGIFDMF